VTDPSSAHNVLSYGVKTAKIGPVDPEISTKYASFLGNVIPDVHKWALSTMELLDQISRNFYTTYMHHMRWYCAQLNHDIAIRFLALVHRMQVVSVGIDTFSQHYLVAIAASLINWKKARVPSSERNALSNGVKIAKIGPVDPEILDQISPFLAVSYQTFRNEPC